MRLFVTLVVFLFLACQTTSAVIIAGADEAPISTGNNVLAAAAFNDAPGSSDLTLRIQLEVDGDIVVDDESECMVIQPLENIPGDDDPTGWTMPNFDDSDWQEGIYGIGYGDGDDNTVIGDGQHAAVYTRSIFKISNTILNK